MKISHLSIIFIIIMLPLAVVLSTYMQLQADVVLAKEDLSTKLLDATYDGIVSFELNTLKIDNLPGTSIKEHVSGAVNTFFDTMSMNMGSSGGTKLDVRGYVPAILFTSYDGYYIYSPVKTVTPQINLSTPGAPGYGVAREQGDETQADKKDDTKEVVIESKTGGTSTLITSSSGNDKFNDSETTFKINYNYMVKPFIYYSANYVSTNYNVTVNYSLDNHIALYARYKNHESKERYATKSGYLIDYQNSVKVEIDNSTKFYLLGSLNEKDAPPGTPSEVEKAITYGSFTNKEDWVTLIEDKDANYNYDAVRITEPTKTDMLDPDYKEGGFWEGGHKYIIRGKSIITDDVIDKYVGMSKNGISDNGGEAIIDYTLKKHPDDVKIKVNNKVIKDVDAKEYYLKAYFFSKWINKEFGPSSKSKVKIKDINNIYVNEAGPSSGELWDEHVNKSSNQGIDQVKIDTYLFDVTHENPEEEKSAFNQHRKQVIQNSIQYNLNSAISTYNKLYSGTTNFTMPILSPTDWDNILNKISIVTFMQGVPIGGSVWGDYAVATSTNNKLYVNKNNLMFIEKDKLSDTSSIENVEDYHRIDCLELAKTPVTTELVGAMSYEFTYDADKVNAKVYTDASKTYKYYEYLGTWYNHNGVKMATPPTNPVKLATAFVRFTGAGDKSYSIKVLFVDDESLAHYYPTECYQYSKVESDGKLIKINGTAKNDVHLQDTNTKKYVYDYKKLAEQELNLYDHANVPCYWCMMGANYEQINFFGNFMGSTDRKKYFFRGKDTGSITQAQLDHLDLAWLTYLGKYRCKQYKTTDAIQR